MEIDSAACFPFGVDTVNNSDCLEIVFVLTSWEKQRGNDSFMIVAECETWVS